MLPPFPCVAFSLGSHLMHEGEDWWKARDLPERLGPMMTKELRQGLRRGFFLFPFLAIQVFCIIAMIVEFQMAIEDIERTTPFDGPLNLLLFFPGDMFSGPFWLVVGVVCLLVMPMGGLILMGQELEEGNHELLLMTPLTRWKVVQGKFLTLWVICLLTFSSLLPYAIVRYFIGGIDIGRNINLAITVILGSAIIVAGALGASSFRTIGGRLVIFGFFLGSFLLSLGAALLGAGLQTQGAGLFFHLNAYGITFCYVVMGLAMARARIRLVVHHYELKPSWLVIGLLFFTPSVVGMTAAVSVGYAGFIGAVAMGCVAWFADVTPKAPSWVQAPAPNIPTPPELPARE